MIINTLDVLILLRIQRVAITLTGLYKEGLLDPHVSWHDEDPGMRTPTVHFIGRRLLKLLEIY